LHCERSSWRKDGVAVPASIVHVRNVPCGGARSSTSRTEIGDAATAATEGAVITRLFENGFRGLADAAGGMSMVRQSCCRMIATIVTAAVAAVIVIALRGRQQKRIVDNELPFIVVRVSWFRHVFRRSGTMQSCFASNAFISMQYIRTIK